MITLKVVSNLTSKPMLIQSSISIFYTKISHIFMRFYHLAYVIPTVLTYSISISLIMMIP